MERGSWLGMYSMRGLERVAANGRMHGRTMEVVEGARYEAKTLMRQSRQERLVKRTEEPSKQY